MTSPSRRKHRTTRWSIRLTQISVLAFVAAFGFAHSPSIAQDQKATRTAGYAKSGDTSGQIQQTQGRFSRLKTRFANARSAMTAPLRRVTQRRTQASKPQQSSNQVPAYQTTAPAAQQSQQYYRPTRRLADLPQDGFEKAGQESGPELDESMRDDEARRSYEDEGIAGLARDEDPEPNRSGPNIQLAEDITQIQPFLSYALKDLDRKKLPERLADVPNTTYVRPQRDPIAYHWMASNLYHNPLYFEDPSLERYGHAYHPVVQPFASAGRMATQLIGLPYQMTIDPIHKRRYSLGWYRPGDCAPKLKYRIPLHKKAAAVQAAAIGAGLLIAPF